MREIVSLNRGQFRRLAAGQRSFARLSALVGADRAEETVRLLYEREARESDPEGLYILIQGAGFGDYTAHIEAALAAECRQIEAALAHTEMLLAAAARGELRGALGGAAGNASETGGAPGEDIDRAAEWIARTLHAERADAIRAVLARHAAPAGGAVLGRTPELLDRIHAELFPEAPATRSPNPTVAYPSSIGGRHVLEKLFDVTADAIWPVPGDASWLDVALLYLGAVGTAQGYADGNKRMARFAYALTLLRGRHRFVEPGEQLESTLIRMTERQPSGI